ncbi:MAG: Allantoinase [Haliscomenobacter sp.]|jgi:dihydroorotase|nr:Allantoinase [Haliscomenobacter sp.]
MGNLLIKDVRVVNRGRVVEGDVLIRNGRFERVGGVLEAEGIRELPGNGLFLLPGLIDDQVHFREPGLTHKADIFSESRAAVAGGVTSFMEMPNTKPPAITQQLLEDKYAIAAQRSLANYSFFMGAANDNLEEVLRTNERTVCGIKAFMGSSTGNMLVDDPNTLEALFSQCPMLIATHCEDEATIKSNEAAFLAGYGEDVPVEYHPEIRSTKACLLSSSLAVDLARKHGTRLHILHISTADELALFRNDIPLEQKRITSEVCVHHLYFSSDDYEQLGTLIKCNPAIKSPAHRDALFPALLDNRLDIIATDHAPHTLQEKDQWYFQAPSGVPLVQHALNIMLGFYHAGMISLERIVEKMCHAPAVCFQIEGRGFIEEGYWADAVLLDPEKEWTVRTENILYKCGWSPFLGDTFKGKIEGTLVNGRLVYYQDRLIEEGPGQRLTFNR